ncbi:MAG: lycopene beta-cyclase CrtY [Gemmatimonadota bacterium]|nr:lycopene beta-cyclase CrtY [Gemmatimonadota bacterium]MDH3423756.1 lycopene beta-cyclase CrtY [Gemmatimonadota bacterium]
MTHFDYALAGGGLQNGLLALALRAWQPNVRIALLERENRLGGNHTWCFHRGDVSEESHRWLSPLVEHQWDGYRVAFPGAEHRIDEPYFGVSSDRFHSVVAGAIEGHADSQLFLATDVAGLGPHSLTLDSGAEVTATVVVDARGPLRASGSAPAGYQKFLGLEIELEEPHDLDLPVLMDATVDQSEGYRFFYLLPMGPRRVLVEDTYFSDSPQLALDPLRDGVLSYAARRNWRVAAIRREESGVLPMPWSGTFRPQSSGPLLGGYRGGWFHPGTGYSFPVAARLAAFVASRPPDALFGEELLDFSRRHQRQVAFTQTLNRLLFRWYPPSRRRAIFERFYRLPATTIQNFYALRLNRADQFRLLFGRPPRGLSILHRLSRSGLEGRD